LKISRSSYYQWVDSETYQSSNLRQKEEAEIVSTFNTHKRRYGVRRIVKELASRNMSVGSYKVRGALRRNGLKAIQPRKFIPKTTQSRHRYGMSPNLLKEAPLPKKPNKVWVGDLTYIPMRDGKWLYLSVWMDLYSRRIVGWDLEDHMQESLVNSSFKKGLVAREVRSGLIAHSDRGSQYAGKLFRNLLTTHRLLQSMSGPDNPYDNAHMESFYSRLKAELIGNKQYTSKQEARRDIFEYIEIYYNRQRRHSALDYNSPADFESKLLQPAVEDKEESKKKKR
jgi:putative transposase